MPLPPGLLPALADLMEGLDPVRAAARGYREALLRDGWSETAAELMATHLHNEMITQAFESAKRTEGRM